MFQARLQHGLTDQEVTAAAARNVPCANFRIAAWVGANGEANRIADITALKHPDSNRGALPAYELASALNTRVAAYAKVEGNVANLPVPAAAILEAPHLATIAYLD